MLFHTSNNAGIILVILILLGFFDINVIISFFWAQDTFQKEAFLIIFTYSKLPDMSGFLLLHILYKYVCTFNSNCTSKISYRYYYAVLLMLILLTLTPYMYFFFACNSWPVFINVYNKRVPKTQAKEYICKCEAYQHTQKLYCY